MPRPKVHDESLRLRLLDAAGGRLTAEGPQALSLRRLAADVGTSTTAVYSLFGGKPGLLRAVFVEAFRRFGAHLAAVTPSDDALEDIIRLGIAYRASALDDPHFYWAMFGSHAPGFEPTREDWQQAEQTFAPLADAVARAIDEGLIGGADAGVISTALWAMVHGLVSLELSGVLPNRAGHPATAYEQAIRANLNGWLVR